jgi:surfeit locus 1 family protein
VSAELARRPPWIGLLVPALAALVLLFALGTWQLERKAWKEALIETLARRTAAQPIDLPPHRAWADLTQAGDEFRRVRFTAELDHASEALVYAAGSAFRSDATGRGYWVFTPARLADGSVVIVNRGFVPEGKQEPKTRELGQVRGPILFIGALRWPEGRTWFTPDDDPGRNLWFVRDHQAIAAAKGLGPVAPFYLEQEAPQPPGNLPHSSALKVNLRNDHLQYAITWYGLAAVLVVVFVAWARTRGRGREAADSGH